MIYPQYSTAPVILEEIKAFRETPSDFRAETTTSYTKDQKQGPKDTELDLQRIIIQLPSESLKTLDQWETALIKDFHKFGPLEYVLTYVLKTCNGTPRQPLSDSPARRQQMTPAKCRPNTRPRLPTNE